MKTLGPLGFPMPDQAASALDAVLKRHPGAKLQRTTMVKSVAQTLTTGEQFDISWISTETPDRVGDVMIAKGMDDSLYALNPIVTLNHNYNQIPIGRSVWRKLVKADGMVGIQAKTIYPDCPDGFSPAEWQPCVVYQPIRAGLLNAKSVGFLVTQCHYAEAKEARANGWPEGAKIVTGWNLLEYSVGVIPVNPEAVVERTGKTNVVPFTPMSEFYKRAASKIHASTEQKKKDDLTRSIIQAFNAYKERN